MKLKNLSKETFDNLQEFGKVASFALWKEAGKKTKDGKVSKENTGDMSIFDDENLLSKLKEGIVFVALNASVHDNRKDEYTGPWAMFHSDDNQKQNDYKLRHALSNTKYEGIYMTDVIKNHPEKSSKLLREHIRKNPETLSENLDVLRRELSFFSDKPVLVALGGAAYDYLKGIGNGYRVVKVKHYAAFIGPEKYREEVLSVLDNL